MRRKSLVGAGVASALIVVLLLFIGGCGRKSNTVVVDKGGDSLPQSGRDLINSAFSMMQPDRLGINSKPSKAAGLMNQWRATQLEVKNLERLSDKLSEKTRAVLEQQLSEEAVERAERDEFTTDDVKHIRTSWLMRNIADYLARGVDGELERAQTVFEFVCRNVQLVDAENALPAMPYEILVLGEGTPEDRAWVFAGILRQLNQDVVIVSWGAGESQRVWFVAAVIDGELHLFDPGRSTAVPQGDSSEEPLTLSEFSAESWKALTGTSEHPLPSDVRLEVIGTSVLWSPRMAHVEGLLTGDESAIIHQELHGASGDSPGILDRLKAIPTAAGRTGDIALWQYPERQLENYRDGDPLEKRMRTFYAPYPVRIDERTGEVILGNPSMMLLTTRLDQLVGQFADAIPSYSEIRLARLRLSSQVSGDVREIHADAAEDAYFWTGVCQMEQANFGDAATKFGEYIREAEQFANSRHAEHARVLRAQCLAEAGRVGDAISIVAPIKRTSPASGTANHLSRRWKALLDHAEAAVAQKPAA